MVTSNVGEAEPLLMEVQAAKLLSLSPRTLQIDILNLAQLAGSGPGELGENAREHPSDPQTSPRNLLMMPALAIPPPGRAHESRKLRHILACLRHCFFQFHQSAALGWGSLQWGMQAQGRPSMVLL